MAARTSAPELSLPWPALRRFLVTVVSWSFLLGVPAAYLAYALSQRAAPVYLAEATLLAPLRTVQLTTGDSPPVAPPLTPRAYRAALGSGALLADAAARLSGSGAGAVGAAGSGPDDTAVIDALREGLSLRWDESTRSITLVVGARAHDGDTAMARANAVADALVAWDDARARAAAQRVTSSLETQLATLGEQLEVLRASDSRANQPQVAAVSLLAVRVRDAIALARSQAVVARGNLEFLQPATRASQVAPSPLVNAVTVFGLVTLIVLGAALVRAGVDRRVHAASGLADVAGVPVLADLTRPPVLARAGGLHELHFLKAHLDRTVRSGGEVLVAGVAGPAVRQVATALDRLYAESGAASPLRVVAAVLGTGEALERAAGADAVVLVAEPRVADRVELRQLMAWLGRVRANVVGLVAARASAGPRGPGRRGAERPA